MSIDIPVVSKFDPTGLKQAQNALGGFKKTLGTVAAAVGAALSVRAVGNFAKASVGAASELEESLNAVAVSYGDATDAVVKLGEDAATRLGVTQSAFNQAAVRFSAFAERVVGQGGDVAGFVDDVTTRATDFASVFNIDVAEALQVFQSGLSGEAEPLKRFGINLLQSEVQAYALREGLIAVGEQMTEEQKVQARYGLLMETTAKTAGDFANTSDGLANSQRILRANFEQMQATVGGPLLKAFAGLTSELVPVVEILGEELNEAVKDLEPVIKDLVKEIPGLFKAFTPLIPVLLDLVKVFVQLIQKVLPPLQKLFDRLIPIIEKLLPPITNLIGRGLEILIDIVLMVIEAFEPLIDAILPIVIDLVEELAPVVLELIRAFMPLIQLVVPLLVSLLRSLVPIMTQVAQIAGQTLVGAVRLLTDVFGGIAPALSRVSSAFRSTWNGISSFFRNMVNGMIGLFEGFINNAIRGFNSLIGALNRIRFSLPSWVPFIGGRSFGINIPRVSYIDLPKLAEGGLVTGPTIAMVGEAGPEAVIPLNKSGLMGNTYNITVNAGVGTSGSEVGRQIVDLIKTYERRNGKVFATA
jgi:phage-related protein